MRLTLTLPPVPRIDSLIRCLARRRLAMLMAIVFILNTPSAFAMAPPAVTFDVPAVLPVHELVAEGIAPISRFKIIEMVIPVSAEIRSRDRGNIDEFRFDVVWNQKYFPVVDYGPRSQTASSIEGLISVDESRDSGGGISIGANGDPLELLHLNGKGDLSNRTTNRQTFHEIPQHQAVVASGTIERGTGAFFRFHPSRTETLEGGREVVIAYRVSRQWQGGIVTVKCRASGRRKKFAGFSEPIDVVRSFNVPVYLEGDMASQAIAVDVARSEFGLKKSWAATMTSANGARYSYGRSAGLPGTDSFQWPSLDDVAGGAFSLAAFAPVEPDSAALAQQWFDRLIDSGDERLIEKSPPALTKNVRESARQFVASRKKLQSLSR